MAAARFPKRTLKLAILEGNDCWKADLLQGVWPNHTNQTLRENAIRPIQAQLCVKTKEEKSWAPKYCTKNRKELVKKYKKEVHDWHLNEEEFFPPRLVMFRY